MVDVTLSGAVGDETAEAVGQATEALAVCRTARGHLYAFHQLIGRADCPLSRRRKYLLWSTGPRHRQATEATTRSL